MSSQRKIAAALGLHQTTVSLALRSDPSIPEETRNRVENEALRIGYRSNAYVTSLMAQIRSGRPLTSQGCIAVVFDARDQQEAFYHETYRLQHEGMVARASALGFKTESFFVQAPDMNLRNIDRILTARGIQGVVLAAPKRGKGPTVFSWERYACASVAYTWETPDVHRVSTHHHYNIDIAYRELLRRGYRRIGMTLPAHAVGVASFWEAQQLLWQRYTTRRNQIPLYVESANASPLESFKPWYEKWQPDALLCLYGYEAQWLIKIGVRIPDDVAVVCLNRPIQSDFSGIEENHRIIGENVINIIARQIQHNELGLPDHPSLVLVKGTWIEGKTLLPKK